MENNNKIMAIVVLVAVVVLWICRYVFQLPDNNPVEQMAEEVIEQETGYAVSNAPAVSK